VQTTLLGFAIGLILALLTALVGPHFVDWGDHRAFIEAEASRLIGLEVRVAGDIDAALLPSPSITLRAISIGSAGAASRLHARSLRIELGLRPLMRGEIRAVEMRLVSPELSIGLNADGRIDWPSIALAAETLAIDRLNIESGRATLTDARSGSRLVLDELWFAGEVRSLSGPFRGKGDFASGGARFGYSIAAGRFAADGVRIKLNLETAERPLIVEADGLLAFEHAAPRFEGVVSLARRADAAPAKDGAIAQEPWRLASKVRADPLAAQLDEVSFQFGPDERPAMLTGSAEFRFGARPHLAGALSARQIDLDRLLAAPDAPRRLPLAALQAFAELMAGVWRPSWPVSLALNVDIAAFAGAGLQNIAAELRSDGAAWYLDRLELRAPGFTRIKLDGRLSPLGKGHSFTGEANVDAADPGSLMAWLAGRAGPIGPAGPIRPWRAKGLVTLDADRIAVDRLQTEFERGSIEGRAAYSWRSGDRPALVDAELRAAEIDLDALLALGKAALSGLNLEWPGQAALAFETGRARIAGLEARDVAARVKFDAAGIAIERLSIADLGDATVAAGGRIQITAPSGGHITADLDARNLKGIVALAERFAPMLAEPLRRLGGRQNTAKLRAAVSLENSPAGGAHGKLDVAGQIGVTAIALTARATGQRAAFDVTNLRALAETDIQLDSQIKANDSGALLALIGLDRLAVADERPAQLNLSISGPPNGELLVAGKIDAGPIDVAGNGVLRLPPDQPASLDLAQLGGAIGGNNVAGRLSLRFDEVLRIDGSIDAEALDVPATVAAAIGMPRGQGTDGDPFGWSLQPFAPGASNLTGRIAFTTRRAAFTGTLAAQQLRGVLRFDRSEIVFDDVTGEMANGRLEARLAFASDAGATSGRLDIALKGAQAGALLADTGRPPAAGRLHLRAEIEGAGRSPAAFMNSLSGSGSIVLEDGRLPGLNPGVFGAVIRAGELGMPLAGHRLREFVTGVLDDAALPVAHAGAAIDIKAGEARFRDTVVKSGGADLEATASINLSDATLDALLTLTGPALAAGGARAAVLIPLKGTLPAPSRTVDTSLLASWLTLHAVEQQAKQLEAIEQARRDALPPQVLPAATAGATDITGGVAPSERTPVLPPN
jgi:uncharacterized protein involved in outer membrane biogenesis